MSKELQQQCEQIDQVLKVNGALKNKETREEFQAYIESWYKACNDINKSIQDCEPVKPIPRLVCGNCGNYNFKMKTETSHVMGRATIIPICWECESCGSFDVRQNKNCEKITEG